MHRQTFEILSHNDSLPFCQSQNKSKANYFPHPDINLNERHVKKRETVPSKKQRKRRLQPVLVLEQNHPIPRQPGSKIQQQLLPVHTKHLLLHR